MRLTTLTVLTPAFSGAVAPNDMTVTTVSVRPTAASAIVVVSIYPPETYLLASL